MGCGQPQTFEGTRHTVFKQMFKPIDLDGHGLNKPSAEALGHLVEVGRCLVYLFLSCRLRLSHGAQTR